ncbi:hypothetical protein JX265_000849 [Neoarthrinium moseri]|uniref:Adenosine deaminase domain-containing protein n=1 Tax=Neoarthrinium moseri TaxID=1658444 RepID=A0A9P9WX33_9PEZI|nr:hypothetical protein JX265_000849 [Neoarthrinium moseri]
MGTLCSKVDKDLDPEKPHRKLVSHHRAEHHNMASKKRVEKDLVISRYVQAAGTKLDSLRDSVQPVFYDRSDTRKSADGGELGPRDQEPEYFRDRDEIVNRGRSIGFDYALTEGASGDEKHAKNLLDIVRRNDELVYYGDEKLEGYGGQMHRRFAGDHYLTNADLMENTALFHVATQTPKGAHLHIHFNSCLLPHVLLDIATDMDHMYISSDLPLTSAHNLDRCEIQFLVRNQKTVEKERDQLLEAERTRLSNANLTRENIESEQSSLFSRNYLTDGARQWMKFKTFRDQWGEIQEQWHHKSQMKRFSNLSSGERWSSRNWLVSKLVFNEHEAFNIHQTSEGAWEKFNGRTRMMKGLFNYKTAFTRYTRAFLEELAADKIQYAEIRPNFMKTNQIWEDSGEKQLTNEDTMDIIVNTWKDFNQERPNSLAGLKVIYCTPRSFANHLVEYALDECLKFKTGKYADYIAGFDLVGEESKGKPLKEFIPQFLEFKRKCRDARVTIPFLFHCGETLELGGDTDGNLVDALLLDSKRIGHGFALARKPYLIAEFKKRNICLEVCPISNEVLGLTPRMNGHAMYDLLANSVHCTISSDNGTLFRSTLSHDFYQVMVGSKDMNLHGWRQLIEWSIDHSSLNPDEYKRLRAMWEPRWDHYVRWINHTFKGIELIREFEAPKKGKDESDQDHKARVQTEKTRHETVLREQKQKWRDFVAQLPSIPMK